MKRPYCVGLTGGIGSGKSRVAGLFAGLGAGVVDTDLIARALTAPGGAAMAAIRAAFGAAVVAPDGGLDRAAMRRLAFTDAAARQRLEAILHPLIRARAAAEVETAAAPYVVLVVPLLVETGAYGGLVDRVLVVDCSPARQIERVMRRDGVTAAAAQAILAAQVGREERLAAADDVIDNEDGADALAGAVAALHRAYLQAAQGRVA